MKAEYTDPNVSGTNVVVRIPVPEQCGSVGGQLPVDASGESYEYKSPEHCMYWFIKKFDANSQHNFKVKMHKWKSRSIPPLFARVMPFR